MATSPYSCGACASTVSARSLPGLASYTSPFGGFCAAIFIIGNGLGSLETAANPYITGELDQCCDVQGY